MVRSLPALWVVPLVLFFAGGQLTNLGEPVDWGNTLGPLVFLAPCCAALCAHETARPRAGDLRGGPWRLVLPVALCVAAFGVTIALQTPAVPPAGFVVNIVLLFVANAAIGVAAGRRLGSAAAVPVGLLVSYAWIAALALADPGLKRSVTDALPCCSIDTQRTDPLPVNALVSLAVVAVAVAVATLPGPRTPAAAPAPQADHVA